MCVMFDAFPGAFHYACTTGNYKHPVLFGKGVFTIRS